eukprot:SAG31_NODE_18060_length_648_cov_0.923497_2_plen_115_part_01
MQRAVGVQNRAEGGSIGNLALPVASEKCRQCSAAFFSADECIPAQSINRHTDTVAAGGADLSCCALPTLLLSLLAEPRRRPSSCGAVTEVTGGGPLARHLSCVCSQALPTIAFYI